MIIASDRKTLGRTGGRGEREGYGGPRDVTSLSLSPRFLVQRGFERRPSSARVPSGSQEEVPTPSTTRRSKVRV